MASYSIVLQGTGAVGKSALTSRYINGTFNATWDPTIEDCYQKLTEIDGITCRAEIFDTAGQEGYEGLRDHYTINTDGIMLVYSVTSMNSFTYIHKLAQRVIFQLEAVGKQSPVMLVANKVDCGDHEVSKADGELLAQEFGFHFIETSAATALNVVDAFTQLLSLVKKQLPVKLSRNSRKKSKCSIM